VSEVFLQKKTVGTKHSI